jgi:hypothetical protein
MAQPVGGWVRYTKHLSKIFKLFSSKCVGEDVYNLITCGIMYQMNVLNLYMMSNHMILRVDVIFSIMESKILYHFDFISVVNQKWSSIHLFFFQIL